MTNKELRQQANDLVTMKRNTPYLWAFLPEIIGSFISLFSNPERFDLIFWIGLIWACLYPFYVSIAFLRLSRGDTFTMRSLLSEEMRSNGKRYLGSQLLINVFLTGWALLFLIPALIKQFSYMLTPYLLKDNPDLGVLDAITKSRQLMDGHKGAIFALHMRMFMWPLILIGAFFLLSTLSLASGLSMLIIGQFSLVLTFILGVSAFVSLVSSIVLSIRNYPRWHMAIALFYDERLLID